MSSVLVVVNSLTDWPLALPGVEIVAARAYLTEPRYSELRNIKVFNLCRSYRYQTIGYYVSLIGAARGHKPVPSITTIQDMKSQTIIRFVSEDLEELIQKSLEHIRSEKFVLSLYFGRNLARRYDRLAQHLFKLFHAPFLRAHFVYQSEKWQLQNIGPIAASEIPEEHHSFVVEVATEYFEGRRKAPARKAAPGYELAILHNPEEGDLAPSNEKALQKFVRAAESLGMGVDLIDKDDYASLAEYDALFIRETTSVNHHTYRFARRAAAEGLVVIDDPESILKCANKVYLAELLNHHKIPTPKTVIVHRDNLDTVVAELGLPLVLKQPDSAFSTGVVKIESREAFAEEAERLLERSDLIIAQEYMPTPFDWRIGVFDQEPIYACKYFMARRHWQIIKHNGNGDTSNGRVETLPVELAPKHVVRAALRAANLVGDGLYGVDIKQLAGHNAVVIEINDNPNIDAGYEDTILKDKLYLRIMQIFLRRIQRLKEAGART